MVISQQESQISETMAEKHLKKALDEGELSEKDYHVRSALQYILSEETNRR